MKLLRHFSIFFILISALVDVNANSAIFLGFGKSIMSGKSDFEDTNFDDSSFTFGNSELLFDFSRAFALKLAWQQRNLSYRSSDSGEFLFTKMTNLILGGQAFFDTDIMGLIPFAGTALGFTISSNSNGRVETNYDISINNLNKRPVLFEGGIGIMLKLSYRIGLRVQYIYTIGDLWEIFYKKIGKEINQRHHNLALNAHFVEVGILVYFDQMI